MSPVPVREGGRDYIIDRRDAAVYHLQERKSAKEIRSRVALYTYRRNGRQTDRETDLWSNEAPTIAGMVLVEAWYGNSQDADRNSWEYIDLIW